MRKVLVTVVGLALVATALLGGGVLTASALEPHPVISIDGNSAFATMAASEGWSGDGTAASPYVISGYVIDAAGGGSCILIQNTDLHFTIQDCQLMNAAAISYPSAPGAGVALVNVHNGRVSGVQVDSSEIGVALIRSDNAVVDNCSFMVSGIGVLLDGAEDCLVEESAFDGGLGGISLISTVNVRIANNTLTNHGYGISVNGSTNSIVADNVCSYSTDGIVVNASSGSDIIANYVFNGIYNNAITLENSNDSLLERNGLSATNYPIEIASSNWTSIKRNSCKYGIDGIRVTDSRGCAVLSNTLIEPDENGINIVRCQNCLVLWNSASMGGVGIALRSTEDVEVGYNTCDANSIGVYLSMSTQNVVQNNALPSNGDGLSLYMSDDNVIRSNNVSSSHAIGLVVTSSDGNLIIDNTMYRSYSYGAYLASSVRNVLHHNVFTQNHGATAAYNPIYRQAYDDSDNLWNSTDQYGNYWGDWLSPDSDSDWIVDSPYVMDMGGLDNYPLAGLVSPPRNLTIAVGEGFADLSWVEPEYSAGAGIQRYVVHRLNPDGTEAMMLVPPSVTSFNDTNVVAWRNYTYGVSAVTGLGESQQSNGATVLIPDESDPVVLIISPDAGSRTTEPSVRAEWAGYDSGSGISYYEVRIDGGAWIDTGKSTNRTFSSLSDGAHTVEVRAFDVAGNSNTASVAFDIGIKPFDPTWIVVIIAIAAIVIVAAIVWKASKSKKAK